MIDKINNNQIRDILDKTAPQQPDSPKTPADNQVDASLQVDYAALIESAKQAPENDAQALQQEHHKLRHIKALEKILYPKAENG